jgi:hypothetical protein
VRDTHNDGFLHDRDQKLFDDAIAPTVACCILEPDLLAKALCEGAGPPTWVISIDPMLDEIAASQCLQAMATMKGLDGGLEGG